MITNHRQILRELMYIFSTSLYQWIQIDARELLANKKFRCKIQMILTKKKSWNSNKLFQGIVLTTLWINYWDLVRITRRNWSNIRQSIARNILYKESEQFCIKTPIDIYKLLLWKMRAANSKFVIFHIWWRRNLVLSSPWLCI